MAFALDAFAVHPAVEQGGGRIAGPVAVEHNARQGRLGERTEDLVVVDSEHGRFIRHLDAAMAARVEDVLTQRIVRRQDPDRPRQARQPCADPLDGRFLLLGRHGHVMPHRAVEARLLRQPCKGRLPPARPVEVVVTHESKVAQSAFHQMLRAHARDRGIVGLHPG
jgi:hypothetical protein